MNYFWTSKKPINGLRHFVSINKFKSISQTKFLLVSVIDVDIYLEVDKKELLNDKNWVKGWVNYPKGKSITKDYLKYKLKQESEKRIKDIFINIDSPFNLS